MKRILLLFLLFFITHISSFSIEGTDILLDKSIEEFSKKNYEKALLIIDSVLELEPKNDVALMYKKTIEDIIKSDIQDLEETKIAEVIVSEDIVDANRSQKDLIEPSTKERVDFDILSLSTYIGTNKNQKLIIENRAKIILGLPIIEAKFLSETIDYDITKIDTDNIPFDKIFNFGNYNLDFAIGARYKPFYNIIKNDSFFDIKVGVTNFSRISENFIPYIGFDTETYILSPFNSNILFNNIWVGSSGSLYSFDGKISNNFKIEGKAGFNIGSIRLGGFYNYSKIDSIDDHSFDATNYGIIIGLYL